MKEINSTMEEDTDSLLHQYTRRRWRHDSERKWIGGVSPPWSETDLVLPWEEKGLLHQNLSAEKVLPDRIYIPLLLDSGLHKLVADDIVF